MKGGEKEIKRGKKEGWMEGRKCSSACHYYAFKLMIVRTAGWSHGAE